MEQLIALTLRGQMWSLRKRVNAEHLLLAAGEGVAAAAGSGWAGNRRRCVTVTIPYEWDRRSQGVLLAAAPRAGIAPGELMVFPEPDAALLGALTSPRSHRCWSPARRSASWTWAVSGPQGRAQAGGKMVGAPPCPAERM